MSLKENGKTKIENGKATIIIAIAVAICVLLITIAIRNWGK